MLGMLSVRRSDQACRGRKGFGLLRAVALGVLVLVVTVSSSLRQANAHLGEALIAFGDQLLVLTGGKLASKVSQLSVNGVVLHRATASTPLGIEETLERLSRVCSEKGGIEGADKLLSEVQPQSRVGARTLLSGTYRHVANGLGLLACIETGHPLTLSEVTERLGAFTRTGDLAALGSLRYVLAKREGAATSLLVLWTEGSVPLLRMFPKRGDAPGRDLVDVPRPEHSSRLLSAADFGAPYSVTVYRSPLSPSTVQKWYARALAQHGWRVTEVKRSSLLARRGERCIIVRSRAATAGTTTASIVELS